MIEQFLQMYRGSRSSRSSRTLRTDAQFANCPQIRKPPKLRGTASTSMKLENFAVILIFANLEHVLVIFATLSKY